MSGAVLTRRRALLRRLEALTNEEWYRLGFAATTIYRNLDGTDYEKYRERIVAILCPDTDVG